MTTPERLAAAAATQGLILRLQVRRPVGLGWTLRVGVAARQPTALLLLGELKGWALPSPAGLRLDTMRVQPGADAAVGPLIWTATFAWALQATPCRRARLLAIRDDDRQHRRLVRYFRRLGFQPLRELGGSPGDLAPRLLWGGSGLLMEGPCLEGLRRSSRTLAPLLRCPIGDVNAAAEIGPAGSG
jgi:hypothetical protein